MEDLEVCDPAVEGENSIFRRNRFFSLDQPIYALQVFSSLW
jgi:hypothetical protein